MEQNHSNVTSGGRKLLDPSELGTKEYWDTIYARELENNEEDQDDEGTVWFSESNAEDAVIKKLCELNDAGLLTRPGHGGHNFEPSSDVRLSGHQANLQLTRFLDLGTGNGHMLFALCEADDEGAPWSGEMVGVDYSEASVQLAQRIAQQRFIDDPAKSSQLRFEQWDLLLSPPGDWLNDGFDIVLDKGTFDAISLMQYEQDSQHPCDVYRMKVEPLLKSEAFLFVTSCNWTRDELINWLAPESGELALFDEAKYPTFTFGGQTGQTVVTLVFRRREKPWGPSAI